MDDQIAPRHQMTRQRREPKRRTVTVTSVECLTPLMRRITFQSPDLADFESAAPDDHIKLFLTDAVGETCMRDYTPRRFDRAAATLTIDFALHRSGPASDWARLAKPGDRLEIGGPRGSQVVADDFDWYLLIGDETALPAIGRRVEELRPHVPVITIVAIDSETEQQDFTTNADWRPCWAHRDPRGDDADRLRAILATVALPPGDGYVWIAGEAQLARALRQTMLEDRHHPKAWIKAAGYWAKGEIGAHKTIDD